MFHHVVESVRHVGDDHVQVHDLRNECDQEEEDVEEDFPSFLLPVKSIIVEGIKGIRQVSNLTDGQHVLIPDGVEVEEPDRLHDCLVIVFKSLFPLLEDEKDASKCEQDNKELDYDVLKVCYCSDCKLLDKSKLLE